MSAAALRSALRRLPRTFATKERRLFLPRDTVLVRPRLYSSDRVVGNPNNNVAAMEHVAGKLDGLCLMFQERTAMIKQIHANILKRRELELEARGRKVLFCGVTFIAGVVMYVKQRSKKNEATEEKKTS
ncbi:hypothetical protein EJB05_25879, partial [Eragrostis curvula]